MPRKTASLILLALSLASVPAMAQETGGRSELEESLGRPRRVPAIPAELRPLLREVSRDRLVIRGPSTGDIPIDISSYEPENFRQFAEGRFFGFSFMGYEFYGYLLVDRAMAGEEAVIATGEAPVFSPDGRYFAAVQSLGRRRYRQSRGLRALAGHGRGLPPAALRHRLAGGRGLARRWLAARGLRRAQRRSDRAPGPPLPLYGESASVRRGG